ncbi:MAG: IS66 family transposase [Acidobacteriia bacterium]|nr:IS66 family transposase [Terriglobia bacterium]
MAAFDPQAHIAVLERELQWAHLKIQVLEERLRQRRIQVLGPRSETLSDLQLELLAEEEPSATRDEVEAEAGREPVPQRPARERRPHPGRRALPENLPRIEHVVRCAEPNCKRCGAETSIIGYDESEMLDVEPARYFVRVTKREKRACGKCATMAMAELAPRIVEKGLASDVGVGELLQPVVAVMRQDLLRASYLQADETTVPVQMHDKRGADHQAYLWQYGQPGGETVFEFQLGRGREGPRKFLGQREGILQTDGYQAYDDVGGEKLVHVGCWAHARRKFVDAVKVNPKDAEAIKMVTRMDALFLVDRQARQQQSSVEERLALRREHADSWATEIHDQCVSLRRAALPKSALGQAVNYTLNMWPKLRRCFDYAEVELSNNLAENSMRPVALGRKNWLHVGSAPARWAASRN